MLFVGDKQRFYRPEMARARKTPTPDQIADAARLRAIFNKQRAGGMTQEQVSARCGWESQGAVSQYLSATIPLNLEAVLKFSEVFGVSPKEISPRLAALLPSAHEDLSESEIFLAKRLMAMTDKQRETVLRAVDAIEMPPLPEFSPAL